MYRNIRLLVCIFGTLATIATSTCGQVTPVEHERPVRSAQSSATIRSADELPLTRVSVDARVVQGPLETWTHSIGHGGVNALPLPDRVIEGVAQLRPRLVRIFIQEFFFIYPAHGQFDWTRLDPYMDAFARTGARIVAAITIKPKPLYPQVDQKVWRPNDIIEWQQVIAALVKRYSVDRQIVTHWEIGNEPDIGEHGGCPYLIEAVDDYLEYYKMTVAPIVATFPAAKVGGPAVADGDGHLLPAFIERCAREQIRLDFVSWHRYSDDPQDHARLVAKHRQLVEQNFKARRPELFVTEWNKGFDRVSVEEMAFDARRAAATAAIILAMIDSGIDGSFYYHLWDQVCYVDDFRPFFQDANIMYRHWNEVPHRFGLFGVGQEVRPQYFVYRMLSRMGTKRLSVESVAPDLRALAGQGEGAISVLLVNYGLPRSRDHIAEVQWSGLEPGGKRMAVWRIDADRARSGARFDLTAVERRQVDVQQDFTCKVWCPADSACLIRIEDIR